MIVRWTLLAAVVALLPIPAASGESITHVGPAEFREFLVGCWHEEQITRLKGYGTFHEYFDICFASDGQFDANWFGAEAHEGMDGGGRFRVANNRLVLEGSGAWIEGKLSCDGVVYPGKRLKLTACTFADDAGGLGSGDHTFKRGPPEQHHP